METILSICLGLGLSAACGFRVFVPLFVASTAAMSGHLHLAHGFEWIGTYPAVICFGIATILEVVAYFIPWFDNLMDGLATPAAVVAGSLLTASLVQDMEPFMRWTTAVIAGGGVAGVIQGLTVLVRGSSSAVSGGLANPILATVELGGSLLGSLLAVVAPILAILLLIAGLGLAWNRFMPKLRVLRSAPRQRAEAYHPMVPGQN
jgi:hypothetical protein